MFASLPIFGVCGYRGSGKTPLLEQVVPQFVQRGFRVAVVKHDVHGITVDTEGKDSNRLFRAGADVVVHGPDESFWRFSREDDVALQDELTQLAEQYDLVLLEGFKGLPCRKVWLLKNGETSPPEDIGPVDAALPWDADRVGILEEMLTRFLQEKAGETPVFGCVLVGGPATRMGRPKHLLRRAGDSERTWLHHAVAVLQENCEHVVLAGSGVVPDDLQSLPRLADPPDLAGPLAGILAAMRWAPKASWLTAACDMPLLSNDAVRWVLAQRAPAVWAVLPRRDDSAKVEPLFAWYDFRCRSVFESIAKSDRRGPWQIARHPKAHTATVPADLAQAWQDADTPDRAAPFTDNLPEGS